MAIIIPLVSQFDNSGVKGAIKEFQSLEGAGAKANFALKKAALPAAAALGGLAIAAFDSAKGAMEDAAAQELLAKTIGKNTTATDKQLAANEDWISQQGKLLGIADDDLRPAISRLVTQTGSLTKAQQLAALSMDIAAATGKPLSAVVEAVSKAAGGQVSALGKLDPKLKGLIKDGLDAEGAMSVLADTFGGAASTKANTAQGQFQRLQLQLSETKETIGAALIPVIQKILPFLTKMGNWASEHTGVFLAVAGVIGGLALAVMAVNAAMAVNTALTTAASAAKAIYVAITGTQTAATEAATVAQTGLNASLLANPITLIVLGIAALVAALVIAYKKFEGFRNVVDAVFGFIKTAVSGSIDVIKGYFTTVVGFYKGIFNGIATLWNNTVGKLSFKVPGWVPGLGGKGFDVPNIPMLADGGIVTKPTLALIGERGSEAVIPLSKMNQGGDMYITVQGGDPNAIVDALRRYQRQNGAVPIRTVA
jgi:hypothetical protein